MISSIRLPAFFLLSSLVFVNPANLYAQSVPKNTSNAAEGEAQRAANLAESGHCTQALPLLKKAIRQVTDKDLKKRLGLDGLHCAMTHDAPYDSLDFLAVLSRDFPRDPEVLYAAIHAYSDLSLRASQDLAHEAPFSFQVHELNAEALELQGKWDEAAAEYHKILDINPMLPGIHARLGRALLSKPQPSPAEVEQARKNFQEELEIDPRNAVAEFVLGQLAADAKDSATAIQHFTRATKLDTGFMEAYLGLGTALNSAKRFPEAIPPLETYEKMAPDSPTGHYQLAVAYAGAGRREDSNREAALQRQSSEALEAVKRKAAIAQEKQNSPNPPAPEPK
ncbi:MAG: tetratricopeptide repeat protein [Acidobacteriia bacterium]|nr:tetratricopeptide repeat protein [Terriglobia bacterium]